MHVSIFDAKTALSKLISKVEAGEEVVITRRNVPIARIVPFEEASPRRVFGRLKGKFEVPDTFFDSLPEELLQAWGKE